ncbi:hypothetical protein D5086_027601 [Populus alba]|uniref:Uncharacterized protein n=1 Tax=Populus alba TaxID=43335 RepID=A0ACC4AWT2_POPAL
MSKQVHLRDLSKKQEEASIALTVLYMEARSMESMPMRMAQTTIASSRPVSSMEMQSYHEAKSLVFNFNGSLAGLTQEGSGSFRLDFDV